MLVDYDGLCVLGCIFLLHEVTMASSSIYMCFTQNFTRYQTMTHMNTATYDVKNTSHSELYILDILKARHRWEREPNPSGVV